MTLWSKRFRECKTLRQLKQTAKVLSRQIPEQDKEKAREYYRRCQRALQIVTLSNRKKRDGKF